MSAREAKSGRQWAASRCFIHEDAGGAPKLYRCLSSSKSESDNSPGEATKGSDHPILGCMPHSPHYLNSDLLPDTQQGLHQQPNCGNLKNASQEQLNASEAEHRILRAGSDNKTLTFSQENQLIEEYGIQTYPKTSAAAFMDQPWQAFPACMKDNQDGRMQEPKAVISDNLQKTPMSKDTEELWYAGDHLMDLDLCKCLVSEQPKKFCSELESHWIGVEKSEPWWRTADKDELASSIFHKSLENFENCDLPRPHSKHFGSGESTCPQCFNQDKVLASLNQEAEKDISNLADNMACTPTSVSIGETQCTLDAVGFLPHGSDRPFRNYPSSTDKVVEEEVLYRPNTDLSKAQLLEALCHSQTRAREAEKAAQDAYDEKEHIMKLFFREASHFFAYKQWLQILQLETLCLQLRNNRPGSIRIPALFPWVPFKGKQLRKGRRKAAKKKLGPPKYRVSKCAVAFAVGLSLAGAGLLLGWTTGWLFPAF